MNLILPVAVDVGSHGPNFHTVTTLDASVAAVERAARAFLAAGLTTVCDAQVTSRELAAYREADRRGTLGVRTVCMPLSHQLETFRALGLAGPFGDDRLRIGALKIYADGSLIGGTAAFAEPYGEHGEFAGSMYRSPAELRELIVAAHLDGWQIGVHVQGDRAMTAVLDGLEAAVAAAPRDHRHRLEHAGYPTPALIERIARLGAITVNQTNYLFDSGDEFLLRLGERAHGLMPLRDELAAGIPVVLSSDSDVTSFRPLDTIRSATERRTRSGAPIGAAQALTLEEALLRAHDHRRLRARDGGSDRIARGRQARRHRRGRRRSAGRRRHRRPRCVADGARRHGGARARAVAAGRAVTGPATDAWAALERTSFSKRRGLLESAGTPRSCVAVDPRARAVGASPTCAGSATPGPTAARYRQPR